MTSYRPPDYLGKAKDLRTGRLGTSPALVRTARPDGEAKARSVDAGDPVVKSTRKHVLIVTQDQVAGLASSLGTATRVERRLTLFGFGHDAIAADWAFRQSRAGRRIDGRP